jgi:hypothetical protein
MRIQYENPIVLQSLLGFISPRLRRRGGQRKRIGVVSKMRLQMSKNSFWVVVPKTKVKKKGWTKGTELDWVEYPNGDLVLQEVAGGKQ